MDEPIFDLSFLSELFLESGNPLTPGSEVTFGFGTPIEILLGRFGNDSIYAYLNEENPPELDIDIIIGDFLDSTPTDREILLALLDGSNPLLILEKAPIFTEEGRDRFILGDWKTPYYENLGDPSDLLLLNPLGIKEFAFIFDFNPNQDTLQLHGEASDYFTFDIDNADIGALFGIDGLTPLSGKLIFSTRNELPDLVAFLLLPADIEFNLIGEYIEFVDSPPPGPFLEQVHQFGTAGYDLASSVAVDALGSIFVSGFTSRSLNGDNAGAQDAFVTKYDRLGNELWSTQLGSDADELAIELTVDNNGDVFFVGQTLSDNLFTPRKSDTIDGLFAKLNGQTGDLVFGQQIGPEFTGGGFSNGTFSITTDSLGNAYFTGIGVKDTPEDVLDFFDFPTTDSTVLYSFTGNGDLRWTAPIGDSTEFGRGFFDEAYGIAIDEPRNAVYAIGWTQGLLTPADPTNPFEGTTRYDAWISRANADTGEVDWIRQFGSEDDALEFSWGIDTDTRGNIYGYGWTLGDFGGQNAGSYDAWVIKMRPNGTEAWRKQIGTSGDDGSYLGGIVVDDQSNIYVVGHTDSNEFNGFNFGLYDTWVAKLDRRGNEQWIRQFGTTGVDVPTDIALDPDRGYLYVSGITDGSLGQVNQGSLDGWLARLDSQSGRLEAFNLDKDRPPRGKTSLTATRGNDQIAGTIKDDVIRGLQGRDRLRGHGGNDTLRGNGDRDSLQGGAGNDSLIGNHGDDQLLGGSGDDILTGGAGDDTLKGGEGTDLLLGGQGADSLQGMEGQDTLRGGAGNDRLIGGADGDLLVGGGGRDTLIWNTLSDSRLADYDVITNLQIGRDRLNGPVAVSASQISQLGAIATLEEAALQILLSPNQFKAFTGATFSVGERAFLALNDDIAGFSARRDAIFEITGFTGSLENLSIF